MEPNYQSIVKSIIERITIQSDDAFVIKGKPITVLQRSAYQHWNRPMQSFGANTGEDVKKREKLLLELTGHLYSTFYVSGNPNGEWFDEKKQPSAEEKNEFMNGLSAANQSTESWDPYWTVASTDPSGIVYVQKNGLLRTLVAHEWKPEQPLNGPLQVGASVSVLNGKERRDLQPVFYYVYGKAYMPQGISLGRFYFNVDPYMIAAFIKQLTTDMNRVQVPFLFKCLNHPLLYVRTDSAVLYIEKKYFSITARILQNIIGTNPQFFKATVPLFTKPIADGVAYAEDPGNGKSFGMFWSEMVAEGMIKAHEKGITQSADILPLVLVEFEKNGVDITQPYLRSNSLYPYDFSIFK
jgi:HopA1 effector protein family